MARPSFQPTDEQRKVVWMMAAAGIPEEDIARAIGPKGISPVTLRKHFRKELDNATTEANAKMASRLFAIANQNDDLRAASTSAIFWLKTRARWKETHATELTGAEGGPIAVDNSMPPITVIVEGASNGGGGQEA